MKKILLTLALFGMGISLACGGSDTESNTEQKQIVEADSLSLELSAATDSLEATVEELEALLEDLKK